MAQTRKGGLGRGLAALIPTGPAGGGPGLGTAAADVIIGTSAPTTDAAAVETAADPAVETEAPAKASKPAKKAPAKAPAKAASKTAAKAASSDDVVATAPTPAPAVRTDGEPLSPTGAVYHEIPPLQIQPNPKQPRSVFDEEALGELVHSIREFGLMQPIVVRRIGPEQYQLVMGERRWRASQLAGLETIPAIVRETTDDSMLRDALLENIHRVQLNPLEEAAAYQQLLEEFEVTHEELASRIGRSRPVVTNMIRLLKLPIPVQRRVAAGVLSAGHARALLSLEAGADAQEVLAARIVAEGMSVRATEEAVMLANREGPSPTPPVKRKPIQMPGLQDVAERLSNSFDTRVTVSLGKRKGKITVEFGSVDDLERIVKMMEQQAGS
ncbi:ParB/RepB/Spo0J family partition protein [Rhodococcus hoagii]|jgi:ParB family chromosome partitioning protein|uniref:ParB/RepB/Spo0J family partition protein n=1 Tax=Rhodococcus hoagii TaxID=43767 RepID=A0AAE4ZDF9_RHOHA|nr:ParB/RepB/Spo0J family partition protein [Prescottella equi]MBM4473950.1 ParB/RepB/Spo0J family partition protein [Prescottella equi]MBM4492460.1 ParB/RepB/Spo0J family partition protein [Prescottella equi]MBM4510350.1 ParB/RepB/Spo0J family partition protein [Prescottella equi]MBM4541410.1 ParB/RepB/Spo0J family partition protein [Prescottella equi]MBM4635129.1 ParB/RepB/Spo0J family partition protein [Prescottella equi]